MNIRHVIATVLLAVASHQHATAADAVLVAKPAPQKSDGGRQAAVVSFVSPGFLFPDQEYQFTGRGAAGAVEKYRPLPAYDKPNGAKIGEVRMTNSHCTSKQQAGCKKDPDWYLQATNGARYKLYTQEYDYMTHALETNRDSVNENGQVWSEIEYAKGAFWVATDAASVTSYESLATYIPMFETWCSAPDACQPADQRMKDEVARVGKAIQERSGCFEATYEIQRVLVVNGKHYYQVKLSEMAEPGKGKALPSSGYIPVRNKDGSHVGQFSSIGC